MVKTMGKKKKSKFFNIILNIQANLFCYYLGQQSQDIILWRALTDGGYEKYGEAQLNCVEESSSEDGLDVGDDGKVANVVKIVRNLEFPMSRFTGISRGQDDFRMWCC